MKDIRSDADEWSDDGSEDTSTIDATASEVIWAQIAYFYTKRDLRRDGVSRVRSQPYEFTFRIISRHDANAEKQSPFDYGRRRVRPLDRSDMDRAVFSCGQVPSRLDCSHLTS